MNNEFKKTSSKTQTVYTLESASSGGTSSGSIASVSSPMGSVQKRGQLVTSSAEKKVPASTPRNFVAKNAKTGGAGAHKDKKKELKQGTAKHKKPYMESFNGEYDDEAGMAQSNLLTTARAVMGLLKTIKDRDNLPEWGQEKIAKAEMMLVSVWDYLQSQKAMGNDPQQGVAEGSSYNIDQDDHDEFTSAEIKRIKNSHFPDTLRDNLRAAKKEARRAKHFSSSSDGGDSKLGSPVGSASDNTYEGVAEGLNEFAPDGFNGGDDDEGFSPEIAKMAQEDGFTKGVSLADGATLERAMTINHWHSQHGGMYKQYFAKGFKEGRMNKVNHDNKQYNLNLKLMKDGSIRHGEQGVAEVSDDTLKIYKRTSHGDAVNRRNIANYSGEKDPKIAKRNAGQALAQQKLDKRTAEGLGKDIKRLATGKDVKSRAGQEIAKSQDASMKGDTKTSKKHFDRFDKLDKLANKGVAEAGDTAKGQKQLAKVHHRAADRVTSKQADKDPEYARKAQQTQDRAWDRLAVKEQGMAEGFDSAAFDRHMDKLRAQKELEKTDPMRAMVNKMKSDYDYNEKSKSKSKQDDERQITDPFHPSQGVNIGEQGAAEGAKVDRQAKHITASMMKKGKSKKDAESIAWAHIKHPKKESVDPYFESLQSMVERQLEPTMDLDAWNDNFQNADPQKYHQFKNKSAEKKK